MTTWFSNRRGVECAKERKIIIMATQQNKYFLNFSFFSNITALSNSLLGYFLNSFWREDMFLVLLFLLLALASAKSLFSANLLALPVDTVGLGLLSKMANFALTNPW